MYCKCSREIVCENIRISCAQTGICVSAALCRARAGARLAVDQLFPKGSLRQEYADSSNGPAGAVFDKGIYAGTVLTAAVIFCVCDVCKGSLCLRRHHDVRQHLRARPFPLRPQGCSLCDFQMLHAGPVSVPRAY